MATRQDVLVLLNRIFWPSNHRKIWPPTAEEIRSFSERNGVGVPSSLVEWLSVVNGANIGPGGVYGIQDELPACSMDLNMRSILHWRSQQWLPIAGDGCGDYYMLVPEDDRHHVYFVDAIRGFDHLDYACASNVWTFFWFLFKRELGESTWPFDQDEVLKHDPDIVKCRLAPLPWLAD